MIPQKMSFSNIKYLSVLLFVYSFTGFSQDYTRVDETIKLYPETFNSAEELSFFITRDFTSEEDKVRAMYSWMLANIEYDPEEYNKFDYSFKNYRERNEKEEKVRQKIIKRTLKTGKAVCEGYAMLFEKLCELQGISSYLVRGDVKSNFDDIGRPFKNKHMWNVIIINTKPYLFDATWGAGKWGGTSFIKEPDYFYYKANPEQLVKTHYPSMEEDTLLKNGSNNKESFAAMPLIIDKQLQLEHIETPKRGFLNGDEYSNEIPFVINAPAPETISYLDGNQKKTLLFIKNEDSFSFSVPYAGKAQNILIYFNDQPALAYRIK
ncbi:transglutaminase domain-containing protein [Jejudonia soesokkakensis]|uniref:Transglutaminase domain-containing protein n=1 Tax=Jejudonia soesokkakensis TaxID=1323432 RepID=A0ABW2MWA2_9FLAO